MGILKWAGVRVAQLGSGRGWRGGYRGVPIGAVDIGEAAAGTDGIDVALRQYGAQPSLQRASPVEIAEQGRAVGALAQAVQVGEKGVCQLAGSWRVRRAAENGAGCGAQVAAKIRDEMIPRVGTAFGASARKSEILQMQSRKVCFDLSGSRRFCAKMFRGTEFEGGGKLVALESPGRGGGICKQLIQQRLTVNERADTSCGDGVHPIFWSTVHTVRAASRGPRCILQR